MANVFSSYHESGGIQSNQLPQVNYPYIPQNLASANVGVKTLTQPQEHGKWFGQKKKKAGRK